MRPSSLALLFWFTSLATAQTKPINDTHCELSVPSSWTELKGGGAGAHSADRALVANVRGFLNSEVSSVVSGLKKMRAKVVEDDASRTLLQMPLGGSGKNQFIQITKTSPLACRANVYYSPESQAGTARKIAESVHPLKK